MRLVKAYGIVPRFAYVAHAPVRDPERFGETVAVNRGMNVKVFETPEDAMEWLTKAHSFAAFVCKRTEVMLLPRKSACQRRAGTATASGMSTSTIPCELAPGAAFQ